MVTIIRPNERVRFMPQGAVRIRNVEASAADWGADWWVVPGKTCVAAYQPKGAASLSASYSNLANPGTNNAAPGTAPDWDATNGWKFNGSSQYLTTGLQPRKAWSALIQFTHMSSPISGYHDLFGYYKSNYDGFVVSVVAPGALHQYINCTNGFALQIAGNPTSGNMAMSAGEGYLNGVSEGTMAQFGGDNTGTDCYVAAVFYNSAAYNHTAVYIQAVALYSDTLTDTQVATVAAAMAAL